MRHRFNFAALAVTLIVAAACTAEASPSADEATPTMAPSVSATEAGSPNADASPSGAGPGDAELEVELEDTAAGEALTAPDGLTLYIFTNDEQGGDASACTGECAASWPAFVAEEGQEAVGGEGVDGEFGTITRDDGTRQVTYEGWPLYYYAADTAPGDANGHEAGGVWFVATATGEAPS